MLNVFRSNKLEVLVDILAAQLGEPGAMPADPFAPVRVVVGSKGMERWLRHQLASRLEGCICANVEFPFPQQVLAEALAKLEGREGPAVDEPPVDRWRPDALAWAILEVLPGLLASSAGRALAPLRDYLAQARTDVVDPRALALACQIADVFDRLVVFRPQTAVDWSLGGSQLPKGASDLAWQPLLWRAVHQHLLTAGDSAAHGALRWRDVMGAGRPRVQPFDQPLRVFGVSALPPSFLRQLAWLAGLGPVELYVVCPSNAYWADLHGLGRAPIRLLLERDRDQLTGQLDQLGTARPHPLLQSLGRVGRDLQLVLESLGDTLVDRSDLEAFADPSPALALPAPLPPLRALHALQSDILHLRDPMGLSDVQRQARVLTAADDSIQLHACYGPTRQVEVLRDTLLHLFEAHPDLEPRDVLVMVPDIEAYVPLIGAVFDQGREQPLQRDGSPMVDERKRWGEPGAPRIPYAVTERSIRRTNPVADVLLRVLGLAAGQARLSSVAVLDLLAVEPFRRRFGIEHGDLETLARWVDESGTRWGMDPADRADFEQPAVSQNTWRFGLERMALGVTMADAPGRLWDRPARSSQPSPERALGVVPLDPLEGGIVHLLGRFFDACTTLFDEVRRLAGQRDLEAWVLQIAGDRTQPRGSVPGLGALGRLTDTSAKAGWLTARVRKELEDLRQAAKQAGAARPLDISAFLALLSSRFEVASGATRAHTGAVTFAAMAPYRSVPYRVICLLGMDERAFPRNPGRRRFDLTALAPRVGDRDPRDEDRHLLLEALLAARDHLLVFYTGRDPRTNERRAPAVPIAELRDVLDASVVPAGGGLASARFTREHRLQSFSPDCFDTLEGKRRPWSYDHGLLEGAHAASVRQRTIPPFFASSAAPPPNAPAPSDKPLREVTLDQLEWFFRNPTKSLLTRGLNLHLPRDNDPTSHREPVEPNGLDRWDWCRRLLDDRWARLTARSDPSRSYQPPQASPSERLRAQGLLPLGAGGERWVRAPVVLVDGGDGSDGFAGIMSRASAWFGDADAPVSSRSLAIDLPLELDSCRVRLMGSVGPVWGGDQLCVGIGDIEGQGKYRLGPWLRHLAWLATEGDSDARTVLLYGKLDGKGRPGLQVAQILLPTAAGHTPAQRATRELRGLVELFVQGMERPFPLFNEASFAFTKRCFYRNKQCFGPDHLAAADDALDPMVVPHLLAALQNAWKSFGLEEGGGSSFTRTDMDDPYVARVWSGVDPITDPTAAVVPVDRRFAGLALQLWESNMAAWKKEGARTPIGPRPDQGGDP